MDFPGFFFFPSSSLLAGMGVGGAGSWPDAVASQNRFAFFFSFSFTSRQKSSGGPQSQVTLSQGI
jgi:hypothetical protein